MKLKSTIAISLALSSVLLLSSCGDKSIPISRVLEKNSFEPSYDIASEVIPYDASGNVKDFSGDLVLLCTDTVDPYYTVINRDHGSIVWTGLDSNKLDQVLPEGSSLKHTITLGKLDEISYFTVTTEDTQWQNSMLTKKTTIGLYSDNGYLADEVILYGEQNPQTLSKYMPDEIGDMILFNNAIYKADDDGTLSKYSELSPLKNLGTYGISPLGEDYYYTYGYSSLMIYDSELEPVFSYSLPSHAFTHEFFCLENGNMILQYTINEGEYTEEKDYTFSKDGVKYTLVSVLINPRKGSAKEIDLDFLISSVDDQPKGIKKSNLAIVHPIKDKLCDYNQENALLVFLSNSGKIKSVLNADVPGALVDISPLTYDRWLLKTTVGKEYLINEKGENLGEFPVNTAEKNESYIIINKKIYDMEFKELVDLNDNVAEYHVMRNTVLIRRDDTSIDLLKDGELTTIISADESKRLYYLGTDAFMIIHRDNGTKFSIYNDMYEEIYSGNNFINMKKLSSDGVTVFEMTSENVENKKLYIVK